MSADGDIVDKRVTHLTNICCAMPTLRPLFSHNIATPPASAPASTEYHHLVFLRTQVWCACALRDRRARLSDRPRCDAAPASRSSSSSSSWNGLSDASVKAKCLARNFDRERACESVYRRGGEGSGRRIGSELRTVLYIETKSPEIYHRHHHYHTLDDHIPSIAANLRDSAPNNAWRMSAKRYDLRHHRQSARCS